MAKPSHDGLAVECSSVQCDEGVGNWRLSVYKLFTEKRKQLLRERIGGVRRGYDVAGRIWYPERMTDSQIDFIARRIAESAVERAINQQVRR